MKDFFFSQLARDLETGNGNPFDVSYLMLQYGPKGLKPLVHGLTCPVMEVRLHCIACLEKLGDIRAVRPLINMLNDAENEVFSHEIIETVRQLCCWERMDLVYHALHTGSSTVRYKMALLLSDTGDENVMKHLKKALNDPDRKVSDKVRDAIEVQLLFNTERKESSGNCESVSVSEKVSDDNSHEMICSGNPSLDEDRIVTIENISFWIEQLKCPSSNLQLKAIEFLRKAGRREAVPALISNLLEMKSFHKELIVNTLGYFGDPGSISALAQIFPSSWLELKAEIVRSLAKSDGSSAIDLLTNALHDNHPKIRYLAAWVLGKYRNSSVKDELKKAQLHEKNRYVLKEIELSLQNL